MNTVERVSDYDYVRQVFLDKGFPEEVIQYVLIRNANYNYENLRTRMSALEDQMVTIRNELEKVDGKIENVRSELVVEIKESRKELNGRIEKLDDKIENVRSELVVEIKESRNELNGKIEKLDEKIEGVRSELNGRIEKIDEKIEKIDEKVEKLDEKIDKVKNELVAQFTDKINKFENKIDSIDSKIDKAVGTAIRPLYWIFGFISTFTVGVFVALLTIILKK
ncbi:Bdr family repetitive protein [Borrelia sp. RT1S]|uniref:Bdr family repetitive protein n=1 Tax=Borrelia sp. RT1S TaxID=2898580 RepID=UPI001E58E1C1|nr:Bdr family repetitive protein [Borrelia sp. RT1S]UGQ17635.1 Bdr family repetitive protein [Borrelia sp. RT1S]UGQ17887.1 Bdr family repetitive protein [Borrelia sp. RT1S]